MTKEGIKEIVLRVLGEIAPEAELASIKSDVSLRDQLDIDSMDFLNFLVGIHRQFDIEIPEADYPKLVTVNDCVEYVSQASSQTTA